MSFRRHHCRQHSSRIRNRGRGPVLLAGIALILMIAAGLPIALSTPVPAAISVASTAGAETTLPYVPPLIPVGEQGTATPAPTSAPGVQHRPSNFPRPPEASAGPGIVATRVRMPSLSIDLPIVEGDGVDVPMNKAAHYPGTAWPAGGTNIYLYAHAREGMFLNLWSARVGDEVFMELRDGTVRQYVVDEVLPSVPWNAVELLDPTDSEQLTLQTCVGTSPTAPRFVVIARPVA